MDNLFTLWLLPSYQMQQSLALIINRLADKYQTAKFEPHMTLLGRIKTDQESVIKKTKKLALQLKPIPLQLTEVSFSTTYFQSVFVRVKSTAALMEANLKTKNYFNVENSLYMPHISLCYDNNPMVWRQKIASEIILPENKNFIADKIVIIANGLKPSDWKHVYQVDLT